MRLVGKDPNEAALVAVADTLLTEGVEAEVRPDGENLHALWVFDEEHRERAAELLQLYKQGASSTVFRAAAEKAAQMRADAKRETEKAQSRHVDMRNRWASPSGQAPLTLVLIMLSALVAFLTELGSGNPDVVEWFSIASYERVGGFIRWNGLERVMHGQVWRLITPIFLHFSFLHIAFNMMWLWDLGRRLEFRLGTLTLLGLVIFIAAPSNLGQYWLSGPFFGGMSGVVYGMLGYVWVKSRMEPELGLALTPGTALIMLVWLGLGVVGLLGSMANGAHVVGLLMGVLLGAVRPFLRRLRQGRHPFWKNR